MSYGIQAKVNTASARITTGVTGSHQFKVIGYSFDKGIGVGNYFLSNTFTIEGYNWVIRYYPDGESEEHKDYLAFYLELKSKGTANLPIGKYDQVKARFNFTMLNKSGSLSNLSFTSSIQTFMSGCVLFGYPKFIERKEFETSEYLKYDSFMIMCTVTVVKPTVLGPMKFEPDIIPPTSLCQEVTTPNVLEKR